jgi:hypothetical protein
MERSLKATSQGSNMPSMTKAEKFGMIVVISLCLIAIALMGEFLRRHWNIMSGDQHLEAILVLLMLPFPSLHFIKRYQNSSFRIASGVITYVLILICIDLMIWPAGPR